MSGTAGFLFGSDSRRAEAVLALDNAIYMLEYDKMTVYEIAKVLLEIDKAKKLINEYFENEIKRREKLTKEEIIDEVRKVNPSL
jgi:hypothetical protein